MLLVWSYGICIGHDLRITSLSTYLWMDVAGAGYNVPGCVFFPNLEFDRVSCSIVLVISCVDA